MPPINARLFTHRPACIVVTLIILVAADTWVAAQDSPAGARWLAAPLAEVRTAAEGGEAAAQYAYGERLLRGVDGKSDLPAAYDWLARAGSNGVVEAQLRMGMKHERAVATARNLDEASRWYQMAVAKGSDAARFRLACVNSMNRYAGRLDAAETVRWAQPLAERGHAPSILLRAVNAPFTQAVAWVREAAQFGDPRLARRLSELLANRDPKEATYWDAVARNSGDTNISFALARAQVKMSESEISIETARAKDFQPKRASFVPLGDLTPLHHFSVELQPLAAARAELDRLEAAAQRGEAEAQFQLALAHQLAPAFTNHMSALSGGRRTGNGIVLNNDRVPQPHLDAAVRWHTAAAKQGHRDAALCLAWLHHSGVLDTPRPAEAQPWLKVAAKAGHADSAYLLYQLRLAGHGLEKTSDLQAQHRQRSETQDWLRQAAELGHLPGMTNYAAALYHGGSQTLALRFLRLAADRGDAGARERLKEWFGHTIAESGRPAPAAVPAAVAGGSPRLAVVPLADNLRPLADLLTADLSAKPGVTLIERAELERVFREQSLSAANTSALKLGELLNAQGVILLETNTAASARFVAVGPGVVLSAATLPLPLTNAPDWSRQLATQFTPWLGKLSVARRAAVPVSLLGLRMAARAADGPELEQGLSLLFVHRLTREREVFALERRRLEQLSAEQALAGAANQFWSGASLVDGAIDRNPNDPSRLTVRAQVMPAGGQQISLEVAGSTTNLAMLADALAVQTLAALKRTPTGHWDPTEEAITFFQEAGWLARWGQFEPALAAMESAWALGLRGQPHALLRQKLLLQNLRFVKLRWPAKDGLPVLLRQPPAEANLDYALRALTAFSSHSENLSAAALTSTPPWLPLGAATLEFVGRVLEEFHHAPEHQARRREQLARLRANARAFQADLLTLQQRTGTAGKWDQVDYQFRMDFLNQRYGEVQLPLIEAAYGAYWAEDPKAALAARQQATRSTVPTAETAAPMVLPQTSVVTTAAPAKSAGTAPTTPTVAAPTPGAPSPEALRATRFWLAPELRRSVESMVGFPLPSNHRVERRQVELHEWAWAEERLWVAWRHWLSVHAPGVGEGWVVQECSHVASYALPDLAGDANPDALPPAVELSANFEPNQPGGRFAVVGGHLFVSGSNTVWRVGKGGSEPLKLALADQPRLAAVHGRLLISVPDELYAYDVKTGTAELLASGRRRPALNRADPTALGLGQVAELPGQRMRVFFTLGSGFDFDFASRVWTSAPGAPSLVRRAHGEVWTTTTMGENVGFLNVLWPAATNWQLAALRLPPPPHELSFFTTLSQLPGVPQWFPRDRSLSPAGLAATAHSNLFWTVTGLDFHQGHTDQDTFMLSTNGSHVRLAVWRADLTQPAVIPLWLEMPAGSLSRLSVGLAQSRKFTGKLAAAPGTLLATSPGLVYRAEAVPGFWFIPWSDVLPRVEAQFAQLAAARAARPEPGNHRGRQLLHRYDLDGDGKVAGAEFAALYSGEKLDTDGLRTRFDLTSRFLSADRNRSGDLDAEELLGFASMLRALSSGAPQVGFGPPGFRPPGSPGAGGPGFPTGPAGFLPGAGVPPRPGQMPAGPPPPEILERYDKNKNGKIDPDEMQELLRDQYRGTAPRPRGINTAPTVPQTPPVKP